VGPANYKNFQKRDMKGLVRGGTVKDQNPQGKARSLEVERNGKGRTGKGGEKVEKEA